MGDFEPRRPALIATAVFIAAGLTLFWPILTGQFMAGPSSDMYFSGYGFRLFGAEYFRQYGAIPQWNPYLFGGLPYIGAMHGDIFYPTAWLRWILPVDTAINLGFAFHIVLAGCTMYALLRALGVGWGGALAGGLSWELSGIVTGLVNSGHDGKLFVSSLTPLLFLAILRSVRDRRLSGYGVLALTVGLCLHGHPQLAYYAVLAAAIWGLWLLFLAPERPPAKQRLGIAAASAAAVALGFGLYAIQLLPFLEYIPYSPRGEGGPSTGWEYVTAFAMPPDELMSMVLPEFNGIQQAYWGSNPLKYHTEYVGLFPLALAVLGIGSRERRRMVLVLGVIGLLFLLISFGAHTPFFRLVYEVMPMMKKARAVGMAYFLVAFSIAVYAGFGAERLLRGEITFRRALVPIAVLGTIAVLGVIGVLQPVAEALAIPERMNEVVANADAVRQGGLRLLALTALALGLTWAITTGQLRAAAAVACVAAVIVIDLWSIERKFVNFQPSVAVTYRDDELTMALRKFPMPQRVLDANVYQGSWLMAHGIPTLLGYHGNQIRFADQLLGGKNQGFPNAGSPVILNLYAVQHVIFPQSLEGQGWKQALGPVPTASGLPGFLFQSELNPSWARVLPSAAKIPEEQIISTLLDPRFPTDRIVLFSDTATVNPPAIGDSVPQPAPITATVSSWQPGKMAITLSGETTQPTWLVVSENWYPDWHASVDGKPVPVHRGQFALITVELPPGAKAVTLEFSSRAYARGKGITFASLAGVAALLVLSAVRSRRRTDA